MWRLPPLFVAVEAAGHEVPAPVLFEQPAFARRDAGCTRHVGIGVARSRRSPSGSARTSLSLLPCTPSNFSSQYSKPGPASICPERTDAGERVPGDDRLGACPAGGGADAQDVPHGFSTRAVRRAMRRAPRWRSAPPRRADERGDLDVFVAVRSRAGRGGELQRTHAAPADVAEPLDRVEALRASAPGRPARRRSACCRSGRAASRRAAPAVRGRCLG